MVVPEQRHLLAQRMPAVEHLIEPPGPDPLVGVAAGEIDASAVFLRPLRQFLWIAAGEKEIEGRFIAEPLGFDEFFPTRPETARRYRCAAHLRDQGSAGDGRHGCQAATGSSVSSEGSDWAMVFSIQCSVFSVQCSVFSVQCSVFSVQCSVFSIQCSVFSVQCSVFSVQCSVFSVQCSVFSVQCSVFSVQCSVFSVQCSVFSVQCSVFSVQRSVFSVQCSVFSVQIVLIV